MSTSPAYRLVALPLAALRVAIGCVLSRPTAAEIARQALVEPATRPGQLAAVEWFAELEEHLPRAYLHSFASDLDQMRVVALMSPAEAAAHARVYLGAPSLMPHEVGPHVAAPVSDDGMH